MIPLFQRRHYEFLANWAGPNLSRRAAASLADALEQDNPAFSAERFLDTYTRVRVVAHEREHLNALASSVAFDRSFDKRLSAHKNANLGRGRWENHSCWRCSDGRHPTRCPVRCVGACDYPRAIND